MHLQAVTTHQKRSSHKYGNFTIPKTTNNDIFGPPQAEFFSDIPLLVLTHPPRGVGGSPGKFWP